MGERDPEKDRAAIEAWLKNQGYPLEYETARRLRAETLIAEQGMYYESEDEGVTKVREIDVVARLEEESPGVFVALVGECKHVTAGWVVLTSTSPIAPSIRWTALAGSPEAKQAIGDQVVSMKAQYTYPLGDFLALPDRYGVAVVQAGTGKDLAYEAITQAVGAALHLVRVHREDKAVVWPFVVADGPVYQLGFQDDGTQLLEPVSWQRVVWRGSSTEPVLVDIVSSDRLAAYASRAYWGLRAIQSALQNPPTQP